MLDEMWTLNMDHVPWTSKQMELPGIVWEKVVQNTEDGNYPGKLRGHKILPHPD